MSSNARSTFESSQPDPLLLVYQKYYTRTLTKIRSNVIPSSFDEKAELHAHIVRTRKDLDSCTEDTTRDHISKTLELQESLLAPIRTLPSEILNEIFQLVVGFEPWIRYVTLTGRSRKSTARKISGTAFLLTWVCVWWRNEALLQPAFWSCIDVRFRPRCKDPHHSFEVLEFLKECILRSGSYAPMKITIDLDYDDHQAISPTRLDALEMLVERADKWRTLTLNAYGRPNFPLQLIDLFDAKHARTPSVPLFPLLEDLKLTLRRYNPPSLERMFHYFPPVQSLEISSLFETDTVNLELLWKLRIHIYTGYSLAGLLRKCPSLKYLKVSCFARRHSTSAISSIDTRVISHPLVSRLEVGSIDGNFQYGAWSFVCLPSLTQLDVAVSGERGLEAMAELGVPLIELKVMIQHSKCTLEKVNLNLDPDTGSYSPGHALQTAEKFFENLPAPYFSLWVNSMLWPVWREDRESDLKLYSMFLEAAGF
ncbi:hypothetical protein BDP27DRAFT_1450663 [Rhodocollybia butyracea]|uniref:F-box domain-containing protein n=1 Tax=Rhodocollybia butyracea TaxID=206335 RepID=A0A9P5PFA6_9AGAR|nr:hypothetical protein BDP27DRAFT_1450663 [Rhodocollybia butyracea]